jgi:large subunit ribosomal protein L25
MEFITLDVARREQKGTAHSRRLRREGRVPAVLYGLGRPNADLAISDEELERFLKTGSKLIELRLGDKTQQAILRSMQHDPLSDAIIHVDLLRIDKDHEIEAKIDVEFKGIAKGLSDGGVFEPVLSELLVRATPLKLPKSIVIDVSNLALNEAVTIKDLKLPEGVKVLAHKPDDHVCHCVVQKVVVLEAPVAAEPGAGEPERIGGKKPEDEAAAAGAEGAKAGAAAPAKKDEKKEEKKK